MASRGAADNNKQLEKMRKQNEQYKRELAVQRIPVSVASAGCVSWLSRLRGYAELWVLLGGGCFYFFSPFSPSLSLLGAATHRLDPFVGLA
jgi:hypothetical protein